MRDDVPAWPPGASRSTTSVRSPSEAPYTAAASPAGPAPTITVSYSASAGSVARPSSSATRRSCGPDHGLAGDARGSPARSSSGGQRAAPRLGGAPASSGVIHVNDDLVAVEEVPQLGARRVPALPDHDRARRRRFGGEALQAARPADPVAGEPADLDRDARARRPRRRGSRAARAASRATPRPRGTRRGTRFRA